MPEKNRFRSQGHFPEKRSKETAEVHNVKFPMRMKLMNKAKTMKKGGIVKMFHDFLEKRRF